MPPKKSKISPEELLERVVTLMKSGDPDFAGQINLNKRSLAQKVLAFSGWHISKSDVEKNRNHLARMWSYNALQTKLDLEVEAMSFDINPELLEDVVSKKKSGDSDTEKNRKITSINMVLMMMILKMIKI